MLMTFPNQVKLLAGTVFISGANPTNIKIHKSFQTLKFILFEKTSQLKMGVGIQ